MPSALQTSLKSYVTTAEQQKIMTWAELQAIPILSLVPFVDRFFITDVGIGGSEWCSDGIKFIRTQESRCNEPSSLIIRYQSSPSFSAFDASSFRQIMQVPFTGACMVRLRYETDATTTSTIDAVAVAAGCKVSDLNPTTNGATLSTWQSVNSAAVSMSAADAGFSTNGLIGSGWSTWFMLDIPEPLDGGLGGYVYIGTKLASGTGKCVVGNASRPTTDWANTVNTKLPNLKSTQFYKSGADHVTTNQNSFPTPTANPSFFLPCAAIEVVPMNSNVISGIAIGDSTTQGIGLGTAEQPHNYNFAHIASNLIQTELGKRIHIANYGFEGKTPTYYINRFSQMLADSEFKPSFVIIQPMSINATVSDTQIMSDFVLSLQLAKKLKARGTIVIFRTIAPFAASNTTTDAIRIKYNNAIKESGYSYLDVDTIVTDGATPARLKTGYSLDGTHINALGNEEIAIELKKILIRHDIL